MWPIFLKVTAQLIYLLGFSSCGRHGLALHTSVPAIHYTALRYGTSFSQAAATYKQTRGSGRGL